MSTIDEPLPVCDILSKSPSVTYNENNYQDLIKFVRDVVGADCWAVTVNEEQIFNSYVNTKTFKDHIIDDVYRDKIIENPHSSIFVHINRENKDNILDIYMFGTESYKYHIVYNAEKKEYNKVIYMSKNHYKKFGDFSE